MIYDCFTFFNELELLELRLNELSGVVDKFVLVEATRTFTNQPKPLYYLENRARFAAFANRIIHVVVKDVPDVADPWVIERHQRNSISRGLLDCRPDDWVLVSDLDEIPRAAVVEKLSREIPYRDNPFANAIHSVFNSRPVKTIFHRRGFRRRLRRNHPFVWRFQHAMYVYFLNCKSVQPPYTHGTVMLRYRDYSVAEELRHSGYKNIPDAGWNFTWMGGVDRILDKIQSFSHQECNQPQFKNPNRINELILNGQQVFGGPKKLVFVPVDGSFPKYLREHPDRYQAWIRPT